MMVIFAFKKGELKVKTQDANFSLPIKNLNPLLKNWFRIWFGFQNWPKIGRIPDPGFELPTLVRLLYFCLMSWNLDLFMLRDIHYFKFL